MKKLLHITTTEDGTELNIGENGGTIGFMICINCDTEPFITPNDSNWLEKKFGKKAVEQAQNALEYLKFQSGQNDSRELFEGLVPEIMNAINEMKEENEKK